MGHRKEGDSSHEAARKKFMLVIARMKPTCSYMQNNHLEESSCKDDDI